MALQNIPFPFSYMMPQKKKCAIIIGVNKTGGLPVLSAAVSGAEDFNKWAVSQGFDTSLLIDTDSPVTVKMIRDAVAGFVNEKIYEQMIVYFSGHGILKSAMDELWLLSEAPEDSNAAVNVQPSRFLSRRCGIPNVVIISDACRSAPGNTQLSQMSGSVIFPNPAISSTRVNVDILYATAPGDPAFEVTADEATKNYCGLYTRELLKGLNGKVPQIIKDYDFDSLGLAGLLNSPKFSIIPAYELSEYLFTAVPISAAQINVTLSQKPDAEVTSRLPSYLSLLESPKVEFAHKSATQMTKNGKWLDGDFGSFEGLNKDFEIPKTEDVDLEALENNAEDSNIHSQRTKTEQINKEIIENDLKEPQADDNSVQKKKARIPLMECNLMLSTINKSKSNEFNRSK
ncbi:caspase family protein [Flavobacterium eburneipallidum]|uniref:caspase family protein n=1 Tax=Flavobacterium eburneipallidum TaxID=3003263 RepID=UPI0024827D85|nr:caspase family protein [Flavobacterium eburneipallidum]